ncbi:MAG: DUF932 domain-containing protein [Prevotellaceae bacterium]|jgi:hypothetical protein|nr:DUF932 domain-containing protein [Prevotellaceae bacterium]
MNTFNFKENKIQTLDLNTLKTTHKENDIFGNPLKGIYHYQIIEEIADLCERNRLNFSIEEIFAAQNNSKQMPGVVILPQVEEMYGENAIQAHILRRVYTTIRIDNGENEEHTTGIAIAFHQDGVQLGFGALVKICHNQTILGSDRVVQNFGSRAVSNDDMFASVQNWLENFFEYREQDERVIRQMQSMPFDRNDSFKLIGLLTSLRVAHDSRSAELRANAESIAKNYPLNQAQISDFTERIMLKFLDNEVLTLWDIHNLATDLYKPQLMEIPNLLPQNLALMELFNNTYLLQ